MSDSPRWSTVKRAHLTANKIKKKVAQENFVGKSMKENMSEWTASIALCFQKGVSATLNQSDDTTSPDTPLAAEVLQTQVEVNGDEFTFEEFAPRLFSRVRKVLEIDPIEHSAVLGVDHSAITTDLRLISTDQAAGKSMAFFMFTSDMRYCIKSCNSEDVNCLLDIVSSYTEHCEQHPDTLLPRFLGLYSIVFGKERICLVVQSNIFAGYRAVSEKYDLKGSMYGRKSSPNELAKGENAVLKDIDFLSRGRCLPFKSADDRASFLRKLQADAAWLRTSGLMDYSLLVGFVKDFGDKPISRHIVDMLRLNPKLPEQPYDVAYIGIVDILMKFNWFKKCEEVVLNPVLGDVSCANPRKYAERMLEFAEHVTADVVDESWKQTKLKMVTGKLIPTTREFGRKDAFQALKRAAPFLLIAVGAVSVSVYRQRFRR
ncbi:hypothetical protein CYMTET_20242 [Cymbomonas tetramitiformis]|uniref:1-phosphatidylinositol-4-phosphate 5-kinase n=1 Tax=Cymbomonas tetramitiformis TaxID=36881 RepID=A0AAE0G4G8_9CHLO|nr:hypothetical protein CYMTET_20242 [Cymbomonas tetramitiformis]|eukprot:gene24986-30463_t